MDKLIFDRTQEDVTYALRNPSDATFLKGAYNYTDLNRIEEWCEYLVNILNSYYNYHVSIAIKKDWTMSDFPTSSEMERIRKNVNTLKQSYFSFTQIPENLEYMTWQKANDIEKILYEIDKIFKHMENNFVYCGVAGCGQNRIWQQRFRRKYDYTIFVTWETLNYEYWNEIDENSTWEEVALK